MEWKDAPGVRDPVLARTWCALTIRIGGETVTRVFDRRTGGWRNSVYGSALPLCRWFLDSLWFLLYEPYRWSVPYGSRDLARNHADRPWVHRHSLLAAREGGALPDLTLFRDGASVFARWLRDGGDASHPSLRFVREGQMRLSADAVREGIEEFVQIVLERVADFPHPDVAQLRDDWRELRDLTTDEANLCAWSARLGINAHYDDELSDIAAAQLTAAVEELESQLAEDLLDAATLDTFASDLEWIDDAHRLARDARRTPVAKSVPRAQWHPRRREAGSTAYATGYADARDLREREGFGTSTLQDMVALLRRLDWADPPMIATNAKPSPSLSLDLERSSITVETMLLSSLRTRPGTKRPSDFCSPGPCFSKSPLRRRDVAWSRPLTLGTSVPRGRSPQNSSLLRTGCGIAFTGIASRLAKLPSTLTSSWSIRC